MTSYRFPAQKNIVPYKRMMSQIKLCEKSFLRISFASCERKSLDRVNPSMLCLTLVRESRLMLIVPLCGLLFHIKEH